MEASMRSTLALIILAAALLLLPGCRKPVTKAKTQAQEAPAEVSSGGGLRGEPEMVPQGEVPALPDGVAAMVEGNPVTEARLDELLARRPQAAKLDPSARERIRGKLLQREIDAVLQRLALAKAGLEITMDELDAEVAKQTAEQGGPEKFQAGLDGAFTNISEYREALARQLAMNRLLDQQSPVLVTDEDLEKAFKVRRRFPSSRTLEFKYSLILRRVAQDAAPEIVEAQRKHLEELRGRIPGGLTFEEAVTKHSQHFNKEKAGLVDFTPAASVEPAVSTTLARLKPGEVSEPLRVNDGWMLLRLEAKRHAVDPDSQKQKERLRTQLSESKKTQRYEKFMRQAREQAAIQLAPIYE
jgi:peptidyl-prolyl cis-trans isomerase SurA